MTRLQAIRVLLSIMATFKNILIWIARKKKWGFVYTILTVKEIGFVIWGNVKDSADALTVDRRPLMK